MKCNGNQKWRPKTSTIAGLGESGLTADLRWLLLEYTTLRRYAHNHLCRLFKTPPTLKVQFTVSVENVLSYHSSKLRGVTLKLCSLGQCNTQWIDFKAFPSAAQPVLFPHLTHCFQLCRNKLKCIRTSNTTEKRSYLLYGSMSLVNKKTHLQIGILLLFE